MKADEFAKQFFDLWQQSASQMMQDPAYSQKMLEMMQQYGQLWQENPPYHDESPTEQDETPPHRPAADGGIDAGSVAELADRLAFCERRIARLEQQLERLGRAAAEGDGSPATGMPET